MANAPTYESDVPLLADTVGQKERLPVLLPVALDTTYEYLAPEGMRIDPGSFVVVPF